jgi:hypothetical protein
MLRDLFFHHAEYVLYFVESYSARFGMCFLRIHSEPAHCFADDGQADFELIEIVGRHGLMDPRHQRHGKLLQATSRFADPLLRWPRAARSQTARSRC